MKQLKVFMVIIPIALLLTIGVLMLAQAEAEEEIVPLSPQELGLLNLAEDAYIYDIKNPMVGKQVVTPSGVDIIRGAWGGTLTGLAEEALQLNLYFNEFTPDPNDPDNPTVAVAAGYITLTDPQKQKRAKAPQLPMSAHYVDMGDGQFDLSLLGGVNLSGSTLIIKLTGTVETFGSSVVDDHVANGMWRTSDGSGTWEIRHLDRRRINAPAVDLEDPTIDLYFSIDTYCVKTETSKGLLLEVHSNVVSTSVRVELPGGGSLIVPPNTDIFSPEVDFVTTFRFVQSYSMEPVVGMYTFYALDATGQPIPGVSGTDVYVGGNEPGAPTKVTALFSSGEGIYVTWDPVDVIPGAFDPGIGIGFYQIELSGLFGANGIRTPGFLIPWEYPLEPNMFGIPLSEFHDGDYSFDVIAFSVAPEGSEGHGLECQTRDTREAVQFEKAGTEITIITL